MITLKAALIAASAVGTVAAGGGATWAMTGSHHDAGLQSGAAKAPAASRQVPDAAPKNVPTCLPAKSDLPKAPDADGVKKQVEQRLKQNPVTKDLPKGQLPKGQLPKTDLPAKELPKTGVPNTQVPGVKAPDGKNLPAKPGVPANLPTCAPSTGDLPGANAPKPDARVPAKPALPALPKLDCAKLEPAVKVGGPVEKAVMTAKGLRYVSVVPSSADLAKQRVCAVTQKWTGKTGQWLTVETLKTPAKMSQNQLRQALQLPAGGTPITVAGVAGWQSPNGGGVLLFDPSGYSLFVNGSPVLAGGGLRDVAATLHKAG
ncbi:hypothetical protein E1293_11395 [Actinomadura darangshiensis]|uniref:DUF3558 domain-containing protein n=1 Tax=Actinomadura darangshiensis TaxID=705336 RepID=A0A4R5BJ78_9ACTN|nr:hypothetical protein [Actinomadura darangshiensis]TDD85383.1 hypothetical protein E1293_11395 [Actinomadura darangshiensis]